MLVPITEETGKGRPETEIREQVQALHIQGQVVMQLQSWRQDLNA
jgi:hypothetical protein